MKQSGLDARHLSLVECHATGTQVGDSTEIQSLVAAYGDSLRQRNEALPIGSLKSNLGHLITAAGVAGLVKVLEAMRKWPQTAQHSCRSSPSGIKPVAIAGSVRAGTLGNRRRRAETCGHFSLWFWWEQCSFDIGTADFGLGVTTAQCGATATGFGGLGGVGSGRGRASDRGQFEEAVDGQGLVEGGEARTGSLALV